MYNWKRKYIRVVVVKVGVIRQCGVMAIAANPDIIRIFVRKMKKCPMYIVLIDFN